MQIIKDEATHPIVKTGCVFFLLVQLDVISSQNDPEGAREGDHLVMHDGSLML